MSDMSIHISNTTPLPPTTREPSDKSTVQTHSVDTMKNKNGQPAFEENQNNINEKEKEKLKTATNAVFDSLDTGLVLKFHEESKEWYAVIENKITHEVVKEIPRKEVLELHARLKEMIGLFIDKKI